MRNSAALLLVSLIATALPLASLAAPAKKAAASTPAAHKPPPPPDYFPLRYKYWWKYHFKTSAGKEDNFELTDIHDDRHEDKTIWHEVQTKFSTLPPINDWYTKEKGMVVYQKTEYTSNGMKADFVPPRQYIKDPLFDGDGWHWAGKGMMGVYIDESSETTGPEEITVPAGKFKCMKVITKITQAGAPCTKTYWYGGNVGLVKSKTETKDFVSDAELTEYKFPKLEPGEYEAELNKNAQAQ